MSVTLHPETQRFIDEQVKAGRFPTPEAVIEAAISEWRAAGEELDDETAAAINEAETQGGRGEGTDLDAFRARIAQSRSFSQFL